MNDSLAPCKRPEKSVEHAEADLLLAVICESACLLLWMILSLSCNFLYSPTIPPIHPASFISSSLLPEQSLHKRPFYLFCQCARQTRRTQKSISAQPADLNVAQRACQQAPQPNLLIVSCSSPPPRSSEDILFSPSCHYWQSLSTSDEVQTLLANAWWPSAYFEKQNGDRLYMYRHVGRICSICLFKRKSEKWVYIVSHTDAPLIYTPWL